MTHYRYTCPCCGCTQEVSIPETESGIIAVHCLCDPSEPVMILAAKQPFHPGYLIRSKSFARAGWEQDDSNR